MHIEKQKNLQALNSMGVTSVADYFVETTTVEETREAIAWAEKHGRALVVLGGGSNVILNTHLEALVIRPQLKGVEIIDEAIDAADEAGRSVKVRAGAGENWHDLVAFCVAHKLSGIENLALIPGDVGAAPIQNIGAYGVELKDVFFSLNAIDRVTQESKTFSLADCEFAYRESVFKNQYKNRYVITDVTLKLSKAPRPHVVYPALKKYFEAQNIDHPSTQNIFEAVIAIRQSKLPNPKVLPNTGSFFKNPVVSASAVTSLLHRYPTMVYFDMPDSSDKKIAAAWLIDTAGWKGKTVQGAEVHRQHALVITNPQHKPGKDVLALAQAIQADIKAKYGIALDVEPRAVGF